MYVGFFTVVTFIDAIVVVHPYMSVQVVPFFKSLITHCTLKDRHVGVQQNMAAQATQRGITYNLWTQTVVDI
jgi:hypothetical protein